jgi:Spy/CpxP family protein refolding chaperone
MKPFGRRLIFALFLLMSIGLIGAQAQGVGPGPGFGRGPGAGMGGFGFGRLNLTDQQKEQIKSIRQATFQQVKPLREQERAQMKTLHGLETAATFDSNAYMTAAQTLGNIQAQIMTAEAAAQNQIYNQVLTQDQRTQLQQRGHRGPGTGGQRSER